MVPGGRRRKEEEEKRRRQFKRGGWRLRIRTDGRGSNGMQNEVQVTKEGDLANSKPYRLIPYVDSIKLSRFVALEN